MNCLRNISRPVFLLLFVVSGIGVHVHAAEDAASIKDKSAPQPQAADSTGIAELIDQLDSNRYLVREQATQSLLTAGAAALDPLLAAANGGQAEPADRAVWLLKKLGESTDQALALAALDRLIEVKNRPLVVREATLARNRITEIACQEAITALGGRMTIDDAIVAEHGQIRIISVFLPDEWKGTSTDLARLADLRGHRFFKMEGNKVGDAEVKMFEDITDLALLQLVRTQVTPAAVDAIKEHRPKAIVYVRNRALIGIGGATHPQGVLVTKTEPRTGAAAAGIVPSDVITAIDGKPVKDFDRLTARISQYDPGDEIEVTILRGKEKLTKRIALSPASDFE